MPLSLQPEIPEQGRGEVLYLSPCNAGGTFPEEVRQGSPGGERLKGIILILGKMPKVKTNSSAKKRFTVTATGKIMHQKSFKRHILTKKSKKRKRNLRIEGTVDKSQSIL
jgi:large subunit ribosomal protein L35